MTAAGLLQSLFLFAVVLSALGFGGGVFIGIRAQPRRVRPAMAVWLLVPIVLVAMIVLWWGGDPALTGEAAQRNAPFATVLYSVLLGVPYAISSFIGLWLGRVMRGRA